MDCVPELSVFKRKALSSAKMIKRLRRFVLDNRPPESHSDPSGAGASLGDETNSKELVCRIPDETLFQLQQIYEALEKKGDQGLAEKPSAFLPSPSSPPPPRATNDADSLRTPRKTPSKKRPREHDDPATENAKQRDDESREKRKKKKARRKSAS